MDTSHPSATASIEFPQSSCHGLFSLALPQRLALFVIVFGLEWSSISNLVHKDRGAGSLLQFAVVFTSIFLALGYARAKSTFHLVSGELAKTPIGWGFFVSHLIAFLAFVGLSFLPAESSSSGMLGILVASAWFVTGALAIVLAGAAFVTPKLAFQLVRSTGHVWVYALVMGVIGGLLPALRGARRPITVALREV
jgi:hypothetical protein